MESPEINQNKIYLVSISRFHLYDTYDNVTNLIVRKFISFVTHFSLYSGVFTFQSPPFFNCSNIMKNLLQLIMDKKLSLLRSV